MRLFVFSILSLFSYTQVIADHLEPISNIRCGYTFHYNGPDGTNYVLLALEKPQTVEAYPEFAADMPTPSFKYRIRGGDRFMLTSKDHKDLNEAKERADYIAAITNTRINNIYFCIFEGNAIIKLPKTASDREASSAEKSVYYLFPTHFKIKESKNEFLNPSEISGSYEVIGTGSHFASEISAYPAADFGVLFFANDGDQLQTNPIDPLLLLLQTHFSSCKGLQPPFHFHDLITDDPRFDHTRVGMGLTRQSKNTLVQTLTVPCDVATPPATTNLILTWTFTKQAGTLDIALTLEGKIMQPFAKPSMPPPITLSLIKKTGS